MAKAPTSKPASAEAASAPAGNQTQVTETTKTPAGSPVEGAVEGQGQAAPAVEQVQANTSDHHDAGVRPAGWGGGAPDLATAQATGAPLAASAAGLEPSGDSVTGNDGQDSLTGGSEGTDTVSANLGDWDGDGKAGGDAGALSAEDRAMIAALEGDQDEDEPLDNAQAMRAAAGLPEPDENGNLPRMEAVPQYNQTGMEVRLAPVEVVREPTHQELLQNSMAIDAELRTARLGPGGPTASAQVTLPIQTPLSEPQIEGAAHPNEKVNDAIGSVQDIAGNYVQGGPDTERGPGNPVYVGTALVNEPIRGAPALIPVDNASADGWGAAPTPQIED